MSEAKLPPKLYRYRPLTDKLLDRELDALRESYLYAPPFEAMNDPMEAFYETGDVADGFLDALLASSGKSVQEIYRVLDEMIAKFALISFSSTHEDLPLWAYYASNFAGMCLEFDTEELTLGDLQSERLVRVEYADTALPPLGVSEMFGDGGQSALIARISRKRTEWRHEKEWRFITRSVGRKYCVDDTLRRVYLGPRVSRAHAAQVCKTLERRPVEVLQAEVHGFEMRFHSVQKPAAGSNLDRVGSCSFDRERDLYAERELAAFLDVPIDQLVFVCQQIASRPNMDGFSGIDVAQGNKRLFLWTVYRLRSGRNVYRRHYFDRQLRGVPE